MIMFQEEFAKSKGRPIIYKRKTLRMYDSFPVPVGRSQLHFRFISTKSEWKQGIRLKTSGYFIVHGQVCRKPMSIWEHTAPSEDTLDCVSRDGLIEVINEWINSRGGIEYWYNGAAMISEEIRNGRRYYCNDGHPNDDFTDLVFELTRIL